MNGLRAYWLAPAVVCVGFALVGFDNESGLPAWTDLRVELSGSELRLEALRERVAGLEAEIESLQKDPSAREQAIREELKLARPGEVVVRFSPLQPPH
ncbi:MAG: septum formation initiator family protein [Proteobacteria bacterium TMED72]|nr:MAG: septum formation initiator family protein [Proteobacteria bacterium TMED72]